MLRLSRVIQLGDRVLQVVQPCVGHLEGFPGGVKLLLQLGQPGFVGRCHGVAVSQQTFAPALQLAALFFDAALLCRQHLDLLLHLGHRAALLVGGRLGAGQGLFEVGQMPRLLLHLRRQQLGLLFAGGGKSRQALDFCLGIVFAGSPLVHLLLQGHKPLLHPLAPLHHKADFGLEPADIGAGFVQQALRLVHRITRGVVRLANRLQVGLNMAQIGHPGLERIHRRQALGLHLGLISEGLGALEEPLLVLLERDFGLQGLVLLGDLGLPFQAFQVAAELTQDVFHPGQVLAGVREAVLGLAPALFVLGDAGGLFQKQAQLFGLGLDDPRDGALPDDRVGARPKTRAQKYVLHIPAAHRLVVDEVAAGAVAGQDAFDGDFAELAPLAAGAVVGVVKHQLHAAAAGGLAGGGAVKDNVLHGLATQLAGPALAQHPAHRVHDVGLAAAVGPDHPDQLAGQNKIGGLRERLETGKLDGIKSHWRPSLARQFTTPR